MVFVSNDLVAFYRNVQDINEGDLAVSVDEFKCVLGGDDELYMGVDDGLVYGVSCIWE